MDQTITSTTSRQAVSDTMARETVLLRGKLFYKLLVVFLALAVLPLLIAGTQLIHVGKTYITREIVGVKRGIAEKVSDNVNSYIDDKLNTLHIVHKSGDFLAMRAHQQTAILNNVMNAYPVFMRMSVLNLEGREIASVNRLGTQEPIPDMMQALRSVRSIGADYVGSVIRSPEGYPEMTLAVPIEGVPGHPIGALLGVVNLIDLSSLVKNLEIDRSGYVYIVDMRRRRLVAHPDMQTLLSPEQPPEIRAALLVPEDNKTGAIEFTDEGGHQFLATYATIQKLNWRVFVQQPTQEAYQASTEMQRQIVRMLFVVFLGTLFIALGISKWIVNRVDGLRLAMEQVGEGNFDVPPVATSNDEFGSLTEKFLWMASSLKDKTQRLLSAQRELQKWNSELERRVDARTRALKEAQEQLIANEKLAALGQMASVVGHELRNPLAVMNNSVYFLKTKLAGAAGTEGLDPKLEKHLLIIESEIGKSNTIIRDVLDFARARALNAAPRKIDELVEKAIERIQIPANVTLQKTLTLKDIEVAVDEDEIRQVLVNLMENACQAMTSGGRLIVGTKAYMGETPWAEISIGDTGCGIPQEHLGKIFAPFFTTKSRGTGLGLAVVHKIIERHKGQIRVQSKVGEGTTFVIRLPWSTTPPKAEGI